MKVIVLGLQSISVSGEGNPFSQQCSLPTDCRWVKSYTQLEVPQSHRDINDIQGLFF